MTTSFVNKYTVSALLVAIAAMLLLLPHPPIHFSSAASSSASEYNFASIEVVFIQSEGGGEEYDSKESDPEGKLPQPPNVNGKLTAYIVVDQIARKVIEVRDSAGNVIAKMTWTLTNITGFFDDDWTGPKQVWDSKVDVLSGYGSNGLGLWLWKFSERMFYEPGMVRAIVDISVTEAGRRGWTSFFTPEVLAFIRMNISSNITLWEEYSSKGIWIFQYP